MIGIINKNDNDVEKENDIESELSNMIGIVSLDEVDDNYEYKSLSEALSNSKYQEEWAMIKPLILGICYFLPANLSSIYFGIEEHEPLIFLLSLSSFAFFNILPLFVLTKNWDELKEHDKIVKQYKKKEKLKIKNMSKDERTKYYLEKYGVIATLIIIGIICFIIMISILILIDSNDDNNNYNEDNWCRSYTNAYKKCHYSYWEKRCVCKYR